MISKGNMLSFILQMNEMLMKRLINVTTENYLVAELLWNGQKKVDAIIEILISQMIILASTVGDVSMKTISKKEEDIIEVLVLKIFMTQEEEKIHLTQD